MAFDLPPINTNQATPAAPVNRNAVVSMLAALLTVLSFCTAVAPIPLTGYVCYPAAALLGLVALTTGITSLLQIRRSTENGQAYAWIGITVGALSLLGTACALAVGIMMFPRVLAFLHEGIRLLGETWQNVVEYIRGLR